jgi:transcriptional regulator with XRE-family HTH domain
VKNNLRDALSQRGISQSELLRRTGISASVISMIVNEKIVAFPGWKKRISRALNCRVEEIFPREEKSWK